MTFIVSETHQAAVIAALRINALNARLAVLTAPEAPPVIHIYGDPIPDPWNSGIPEPAPTPLVTMTMAGAVGTVNEEEFRIEFVVPIEGQVNGADPTTGTTATWAAIFDGDGVLWGYGTVTDPLGAGDFKLQETLLLQGAFTRLTSAWIQG